MPYDAFISYCSQDKKIADAVCGTLEANKIRCWIAPRDVLPGRTWGAAIIEAIEESAVMVIIFSRHSNASPQVLREIERAVNKGVTIIPFRVEDVMPSSDLEYFISSSHWLDAMTPPLERHIDELARVIKVLKEKKVGAGTAIREVRGGTEPVEPEEPKPRRIGRKAIFVAATVLVLAALLAAGAWWRFGRATRNAAAAIEIDKPANGASLVGPVLLSWRARDLPQENLAYEVSLTPAGKPAIVQRTARDSIVPPRGVEGQVRWKVRPVWQAPGTPERFGAWSSERSFTYYITSLNRIVATRVVHVGIAEPDGFFVREEGAELSGYEIDLLRDVVTRTLAARGINSRPTITYTRRVWGEEFFRLLELDGAVDVLASAISITADREKKYGIAFTEPTLKYPQTLITNHGVKALEGGKLLVNRIGAAAGTTNETLARRLLGEGANDRFVPYSGSSPYDRILTDLIADRIDAALIDKPYALQKVAALTQSQGVELQQTDITPEVLPGIELEKMGFALRKSDRVLLQELNAQLAATASQRDGALSSLIPGWSR